MNIPSVGNQNMNEPQKNKKGVLIASVAILVIFTGVLFLVGRGSNNPVSSTDDLSEIQQDLNPSEGASNTAKPATGGSTSVVAQPVSNTLGKSVAPDSALPFQIYSGSYGLDKVLLVYSGNTVLDIRLSDGRSIGTIDKQKITRETLVLSFAQGGVTPVSFLFSGDGKRMVLSLTRGSESALTAEVYRIDLSTIGKTTATRLISYAVAPSSARYGIWKGVPQVTRFVEDRYAVLSVPLCRNCDPGVARGVSVVSVSTGKEIFLGEAGDLTFNLAADTVSYRMMGSVTVPCASDDFTGPAPKCEAGETTKTVYQASGAVKTVKLP